MVVVITNIRDIIASASNPLTETKDDVSNCSHLIDAWHLVN
jgi:hypothetical protein